MTGPKDRTLEYYHRLKNAPCLALVAYFHPAPRKAGDLFSKLIAWSRECLGNLRVSGKAVRHETHMAPKPDRIETRVEFERRIFVNLPNTLRRNESGAGITGLNTGKLSSTWVRQMSLHRDSGCEDLVYLLHYDSDPYNHSTRIDPTLQLFVTRDRLTWRRHDEQRFIVGFFEIVMAAGRCYGGLADVVRSGETMASLYHRYCAGSGSQERSINNYLWIKSGERRRGKVRGVYWGTLLTDHVVNKIGGAALVREKWSENSPPHAIVRPRVHDVGGKAVLMALTDEPKNIETGFSYWQLEPATWLYSALRDADLLL